MWLPSSSARTDGDVHGLGASSSLRHWNVASATVDENELLLLADAQTSGGLLLAGEVPGLPVIGEIVPRAAATLIVR